MKKRKVDPWFPFWIDKWLFGSTRIELEPDERGVFVDLMSLSKKDDGYIRANEGVPYLDTQLCGLLNITPELYHRTVEKCIKYGKARKLKDGTLYMTSHDVYKLSGRQERRIESEMAEENDTMANNEDIEAKKEDTILYKNKGNEKENKKKEEGLSQIEREILNELKKVKNYPYDFIETIKYIRELSVEFPDVDILEEIKKKCAWWHDKPLLKRSNPHLQLRNWLKIGSQWAEEQKMDRKVGGSPLKKTPKEEKAHDEYMKKRLKEERSLMEDYGIKYDSGEFRDRMAIWNKGYYKQFEGKKTMSESMDEMKEGGKK